MDDLAKVAAAGDGESLEQVEERFRLWREGRGCGDRIPQALWSAAIGLAGKHGVYRVSRALHLDYKNLKRRQQEQAGGALGTTGNETRFVELTVSPAREPVAQRTLRVHDRTREPARRKDAGGTQWPGPGRSRRPVQRLLVRRMIQITPHMRLLVAVEPIDFRAGIDGLAGICRQRLAADPFSGGLFIFRNRARTAIKILVYDGQGFWLCQKRLCCCPGGRRPGVERASCRPSD
jgi:hypothetical protein